MTKAPAAPPRGLWTSASPPVLLAWLLAAPFAFQKVGEVDAGWHLALGRLIASRGIPFENALSWTFPHAPWYATSWLYDLGLYGAMRAGGVLGMQLVTFGLVAATLLLVARAGRRLDPLGAWLAPVVAMLLAPRITERPHVVSWLVLAAVLVVCLRGTFKARASAIALVAVGSNFHAGAVFGAGLLGAFCLEAFLQNRRPRELVVGALGLAAILANPGGFFLARYLVSNLHVASVVRIAEEMPTSPLRGPTFYLMLVLALVAAWRLRRERPAFLVLTVVFGALGIYALRLVYDFEIVSVAPLAGALGALRGRARARAAGLAVAALFAVVFAARARFYVAFDPGATFDGKALPVGAARYVAEAGLDGRFFNGYRDGGYLEWALPDRPVFQDARLQAYPPDFFRAELEAERSPAKLRAWLRSQGVEWALASRVKEPLDGNGAFDAPDWALVYSDDASEVVVRRDVPRLAAIVQRDELRCLSAKGSLLGRLTNLAPPQLARCAREADRVLANSDDPFVAILRCGALRRLGAGDAPMACEYARILATTDAEQRLVARAQALGP